MTLRNHGRVEEMLIAVESEANVPGIIIGGLIPISNPIDRRIMEAMAMEIMRNHAAASTSAELCVPLMPSRFFIHEAPLPS